MLYSKENILYQRYVGKKVYQNFEFIFAYHLQGFIIYDMGFVFVESEAFIVNNKIKQVYRVHNGKKVY